jgi:Winged helix-turn helix
MRLTDILGRSERSGLSQMEAAELLGISERTFRRWRDRHRDAGPAGLDDRRLTPSLRRAPVAEIERMLGLYRDLYRGFRACARRTPWCEIPSTDAVFKAIRSINSEDNSRHGSLKLATLPSRS